MGIMALHVMFMATISVALCVKSKHHNLNQSKMNQCPAWQEKENNNQCSCGSNLKNTVICQDNPYLLKLLGCYCMTSAKDKNDTVVGACQYTCHGSAKNNPYAYYFTINALNDNIDEFMCKVLG